MTQPVTDWDLYRKCRICRADTGENCTSFSSRIIDGQPDGMRTLLEHPHGVRQLRVLTTI